MNLKLNPKSDKSETIDETLPVPIPTYLKRDVDRLKKVCGKAVNEKIREFIKSMVDENKGLIDKAG